MHSPGINGEGELRGQPANPGSPGKMAVKMECVCVCSLLLLIKWASEIQTVISSTIAWMITSIMSTTCVKRWDSKWARNYQRAGKVNRSSGTMTIDSILRPSSTLYVSNRHYLSHNVDLHSAFTWNTSKVLRYSTHLSRDNTVLPAHPAFHPQAEWATPAFATD